MAPMFPAAKPLKGRCNAATGVVSPRVPATLDLYITDRCNLRCRHCYLEDDGPKHEMSLDDVTLALSKAREFYHGGISRVNLLGGEPFFARGFEAIAETLSQECEIAVSTNSCFVCQSANSLLQRFSYIQFSTESFEASEADYWRGSGFFGSLLSAVERVRGLGIPFGFKLTLNKRSCSRLAEEIGTALTFGPHRIALSRHIPMGTSNRCESASIDKEDLRAAMLQAALAMVRHSVRIDFSDGIWFPFIREHFSSDEAWGSKMGGCIAGQRHLSILPNGDVMTCRRLDLAFSNIFRDECLEEALRQSSEMRSLMNRELLGACGACSKLQACGGGCRAYVKATCGSLLAEDPLCFLRSGATDNLPNAQ